MELGLKNRVALVAAASQGIGYACALDLAREGARVFLCSRNAERASQAARKIHEETGATVAGIAADITNDAAAEAFVALAKEQAGTIDVLVTNGGGPPAGVFDDVDVRILREAFELTVVSAIRMAKLVLPTMKQQKHGRIINITSMAVKQPIDGLLLSNTMRAGLTGWSKTLSNEVAQDNITVNNVAPGYTLTEQQHEHAITRARKLGKSKEEMLAVWAAQAPINRLANPEEIAAAVTFLASDRASYITGITLQVDGGWSKGLL
ncbi:MAG TPA: SDR family oxidoreductase [Pyrinomonadaceae bacterium]|nr:SDR family oxidoreductase [Pyrinomonadaceae bacterium]